MKKTLIGITAIIAVALLALLVYSIERSAWFLSLYETAKTADDTSGPALAMAAAVVLELAAVALIVGEAAISLTDAETKRRLVRWSNNGLVLVLSLQSVAGIVAGYTRGGARMLDIIGTGNEWARFAVAAVALILGNLAVPGLILALSKIASLLVAQIVAMPTIHAMPSYAYARPAAPVEVASCGVCGASHEGQTCDKCGTREGHQMPIPEGINASIGYACPKCQKTLTPAQFGAAKRWGHCKACKSA